MLTFTQTVSTYMRSRPHKPKKSIYDWMGVRRMDKAMYALAKGERPDAITLRLQIEAANDGFNKRQIKAIETSVLISAAYVSLMQKENKRLKDPERFMAWLAQQRVQSGICTEREALNNLYALTADE